MLSIVTVVFVTAVSVTVLERHQFEFFGTNISGQHLTNTTVGNMLQCARSCLTAEYQVLGCKAWSFNSAENVCLLMLSLNRSSPDDNFQKWRTYKLTSCVDEWLFWGGSCYKMFMEKANWTDARQNCRNIGAHLAALETVEESHFVWTEVVQHLNMNVYLGGRDLDQETVWRWEDDDDDIQNDIHVSMDNLTSAWKAGEPNNMGEEDCLILEVEGTWNDAVCGNQFPFICEYLL